MPRRRYRATSFALLRHDAADSYARRRLASAGTRAAMMRHEAFRAYHCLLMFVVIFFLLLSRRGRQIMICAARRVTLFSTRAADFAHMLFTLMFRRD